jgi:hypothetical protein
VLDLPYGRRQPHRVPELLGDAQRDELRTADEAVLLRPALGRGEDLEALPGTDVEQDVKERDVARLGGPDALDQDLDQHAGRARVDVAAHPGPERLRVEPLRPARLPRRVERDSLGHALELRLRLEQVGDHVRGELGPVAGVAVDGPGQLEDVLALDVGRVRVDPNRARQRGQPVLGRADPLAADLDDLAVAEFVVERPAAGAVARLEDHHRRARGGQLACRRQPGEPRADDYDVGLERIHVVILTAERRPARRP